jgi:DNA-binding response OmpR family regulator
MFPGTRILIAEDDYFIAQSLRLTLKNAGGRPQVAHSQEGAIELLDQVDAAVVDLQLRDGPCTGLIGALRSRSIPFFVASGFAREVLPRDVRDAPFIRKPFIQHELLDMAVRIFTGQHLPN